MDRARAGWLGGVFTNGGLFWSACGLVRTTDRWSHLRMAPDRTDLDELQVEASHVRHRRSCRGASKPVELPCASWWEMRRVMGIGLAWPLGRVSAIRYPEGMSRVSCLTG